MGMIIHSISNFSTWCIHVWYLNCNNHDRSMLLRLLNNIWCNGTLGIKGSNGLSKVHPILDTWFYGNYAVSYAMLSKCMVFHFLIVMIALVLMILHLIMLHSTGSTAGTSLTTAPGYHSK